MKVKRKIPDSAKKFYPIIIEIETEDEAYALWNRLNLYSEDVLIGDVDRLRKVEVGMIVKFDEYYSPED